MSKTVVTEMMERRKAVGQMRRKAGMLKQIARSGEQDARRAEEGGGDLSAPIHHYVNRLGRTGCPLSGRLYLCSGCRFVGGVFAFSQRYVF